MQRKYARKKFKYSLTLNVIKSRKFFFKKMIVGDQTGGFKKNKKIKKIKKQDEIISDSLFDKLIDLKSKTNLKQTRKHKKVVEKK